MSGISVTEKLYFVVLSAAMILLLILLHNTIVLYKRKLSDPLSLMLLCDAVMCAFEILWSYCSGIPRLAVPGYLGACGYVMSFVAFGVCFSRFFLEQFDLIPQKKSRRKALYTALYVVPCIVMFLMCVTTPWTHLIFMVDEAGIVQEMILFRALFYSLLLVYLFTALIPAVYYAFLSGRADRTVTHMARSLIVFAILGPLFFGFQYILLGEAGSDYLALSLACALALVYLTNSINTHLLMESQARVEAVETELRIAAKIQTDALPPVAPEFADHLELNLRAAMTTAREVGGDFYDYFAIDDHRICFLIADVSGKGTPAALFMMTAKTMIRDYAMMRDGTADIFTSVNRRLSENNREGMFATAWIGILDTRTMILQYTNAGHNYPLIKPCGEPCTLLKKKHGLFLAGMDDTEYRQSELQLHGGDRLLLYTDGVTEAHSSGSELYGSERLCGVIDRTAADSGEAVLEAVLREVNEFSRGEPQFDDITMMILTVRNREE